MKFNTIEELLHYTEAIKGKTFKEIDSEHLLENTTNLKGNKGVLGQVVETGFYKYPINTDPRADFDKIGVELKVTGYKKNKKGEKSAKERVSLSKIDFNKIVNEEYEYSKLIYKNKKILFIWYFYEKGKDIGDFLITDYQLYDMSKDEETIKNDFYIIKQKVKDGRAHELSESDTSYLGACTKARTSKDRTTQPNSTIPAKPRAYSLKNSYMSGILNSIGTTISFDTNEFKTVEEYVLAKLRPYIGKSQLEILEEITGQTYKEKIPKNLNKMITDKIIGKDDELAEKDDLGRYRERMSFRNLTLSEFEDTWEDSYWKLFFDETAILNILWKEPKSGSKNGERILEGVNRISFNDDDLDSIEKSYNMVKETIEKEDVSLLPYPNSFENQILEIGPKGQKSDDAYNTFFNKDTTKTCFFLNKEILFEKKNKNFLK